MDGLNTSFLLEWPVFRAYVSFRECNMEAQRYGGLEDDFPLASCFMLFCVGSILNPKKHTKQAKQTPNLGRCWKMIMFLLNLVFFMDVFSLICCGKRQLSSHQKGMMMASVLIPSFPKGFSPVRVSELFSSCRIVQKDKEDLERKQWSYKKGPP